MRDLKRKLILGELHSKLWHTTHPGRFEKILQSGSISPEPHIPNTERWKTSGGPDLYPYVRRLGGVSLFDFDSFDPDIYTSSYPNSSWTIFVPYRIEWCRSVWIEISREKIRNNFIPARKLIEKWKADEAYRHTIMPGIEAAHIGELPISAFLRAFIASESDSTFQEMDIGTAKVRRKAVMS